MGGASEITAHAKRENAIADWMAEILDDGGIERYDHLHIDRVDSRWAARENWVRCGMEAFRIALLLRDQRGLDVTVALGFSLESSERLRGVDFRTLDEFQAQMDWSPPSLYLYRRGREAWTEIDGEPVQLDRTLFGIRPEASYYIEFKRPDSPECYRSVFLAG